MDVFINEGMSLANAILSVLDLLLIMVLVWLVRPGFHMATRVHIVSAKLIFLAFGALGVLTAWGVFLLQINGDTMRFVLGFLAMTLRFSIVLLAAVWIWDAGEQYLGCSIQHWITCWYRSRFKGAERHPDHR